MRYFKDPAGDVFGYDEARPSQAALMTKQAVDEGWQEVTASWPPPPTLGQAQARAIRLLARAHAASRSAPVCYTTAAGVDAAFARDQAARDNLAETIAAGAAKWTANLWLDADGNVVSPFSFADLEGLSAAIAAFRPPAHAEFLVKVAAVHAATTADAVAKVTP
ncbi:hypothetical protein [Novosphingobium sp. FSW06-99]|uniref:hypothetical protein n=1 Tax=Novosphingobium sp. FSW06-99 TaxID=1739113 RepID=UPI00076C7800|nr:hypothetical protein [Novosphingobium sp. FSW06-99]KUR80748.1 hypothetical protein AQZ49_01595 [Novosphingobium sp. FSW06-99]